MSALIAAAMLTSCGGGGVEVDADLILAGGLIWYGPGAPVAAGESPTSIAIANGKVLAVGDDAELEAHVGPATRRIDLAGRRVIPGFMDSHTHFIAGGFELAGVQLRDASTPEEFARRIADFASAHPAEWIVGGTWDHELWGGELPRRDWIDASTGDTPVFVSRLDGHMALANSRALELAGVTAETGDPAGGTIERDPDGWVPEERISVTEAVAAYTAGNAHASFLDDELGELTPGRHADLVVLSDDIFTIDPRSIENVRVDLTIVEGEVVSRRPSAQ